MTNEKQAKIDAIDRRILNVLMDHSDTSLADISKKVGLSQTPCWQRIQKLENSGVIKKRVAIVDAEKVGLGLTIFVSIEANEHTANWLHAFTNYINKCREVVEVFRMAGDVDYILKLIVSDMTNYDNFYKGLIENVSLKKVSSRFVMETIKATSVLPLAEPKGDF